MAYLSTTPGSSCSETLFWQTTFAKVQCVLFVYARQVLWNHGDNNHRWFNTQYNVQIALGEVTLYGSCPAARGVTWWQMLVEQGGSPSGRISWVLCCTTLKHQSESVQATLTIWRAQPAVCMFSKIISGSLSGLCSQRFSSGNTGKPSSN